MNWTTPAALRAQVQRLWDRGDLLRAAIDEDAIIWPRRLSLKSPSARDLTDRFHQVASWATDIAGTRFVRVEWREWSHRVQGRQRLPDAIWVDTLDDALAIVGKAGEAKNFERLQQRTAAEQPAILPWLVRRPLNALALADAWDRLLAVVAWLQAHPQPDIYLRQVDVANVDTKFIEAHRATLSEWLDCVLPEETVDVSATGMAGFARRYGFREKPVCIRFRPLDADLISLPGCRDLPDITLDADSFAQIVLPARRVFITENEINFLAFPPLPAAVAIFGKGYGWQALARAKWLHHCTMHYWGDIDTHGFVILDRLRAHFPRVDSFLMDRQTLFAHQAHWGEEPQAARQDLGRLTQEEAALYDELRFDRIRPGLRLEQERIGFGWVAEHLGATLSCELSG